jgi:hypothetical protein
MPAVASTTLVRGLESLVDPVSLDVIGDIEPAARHAKQPTPELLVAGGLCTFLQSPRFTAIFFGFRNHD